MGSYEFGQKIGQGGMGDVFLGVQHGLGGFRKQVVLKRILPKYSQDDLFVDMFIEEARLAAAIRHPNVVEIYDIRVESDGLFIAMEYIDGLTIAEILHGLGGEPIPPLIAAHIVADVAAGLHAAHTAVNNEGMSEPIIHLDVTPSNLMLDINGNTKLLDYGIALVADSDGGKGYVRGKPGYVPPEYVASGIVDPRGDLFQLGLVLHEMLVGRAVRKPNTPLSKTNLRFDEPILAPSHWRSDIPAALDAIVLSATATDIESRLHSAEALQNEILAFLRDHGNLRREEVAEWLSDHFCERLARKYEIEQGGRSNGSEGLLPFDPQIKNDLLHGQTVDLTACPEGMESLLKSERTMSLRTRSTVALGPTHERFRILASVSVFLVLVLGVFIWSKKPWVDASASRAVSPAIKPPAMVGNSLPEHDKEESGVVVIAEKDKNEIPDAIPSTEPSPIEPSPIFSIPMSQSPANTGRSTEGRTAKVRPSVPVVPKAKTPEVLTDLRDPWAQ